MAGKNPSVTTMLIESGKSSNDTLQFDALNSPVVNKLESIVEQKEMDTTE